MGARTTAFASGRHLGALGLTTIFALFPLASAERLSSRPTAPEPEVFSIGNGTLRACANRVNGQLRLLMQSAASCLPSEVAVFWNTEGPQGPPGPPGSNGTPGSPGVSGLERIDFSSRSDSTTALKHAFARCPSGKHVVGGGANITIAGTAVGAIALKKSNPDDELNGWAATAEAFEPGPNWFITAYALCANVAE